jgi:hypothetical protein
MREGFAEGETSWKKFPPPCRHTTGTPVLESFGVRRNHFVAQKKGVPGAFLIGLTGIVVTKKRGEERE